MRADDDTTESPGPVSIEFVEDVPSTLGTRAKAEDKLAVSITTFSWKIWWLELRFLGRRGRL